MMRQFHSNVKFKGPFGISKLLIGMQVDVRLNAHSCKIIDSIISDPYKSKGYIYNSIDTSRRILIHKKTNSSIIIFFYFSSNGCWTRSWAIFQNLNLEIKYRNISAVLFLVSIKTNTFPILLYQFLSYKCCRSLSYKKYVKNL